MHGRAWKAQGHPGALNFHRSLKLDEIGQNCAIARRCWQSNGVCCRSGRFTIRPNRASEDSTKQYHLIKFANETMNDNEPA